MGADALLLALGLALLLGGAEVMIRGSTGLARGLGVSPLAIGLTVVAFGTSAPELAVNVTASLQDRGDICFGNIIGSNLANIGLIVGCTALIRPISIRRSFVAREITMMQLATAATVVLGFDTLLGRGPDLYSRGEALVFLLLFLMFIVYTVGDFVRQREQSAARHVGRGAVEVTAIGWPLLLTGAGLAGLVGGADLTVDAAVGLARSFGVSEAMIGLTMLAIGTSLPELVASVMSTMRGHVELAIGNVVGSNIFNLCLVLGVSGVLRPIAIPDGGHWDLAFLGGISSLLMLVSITARRNIIRTDAALLMLTYVGYMAWRVGSAS